MKKINIEIDKLILNGFDYHDHSKISLMIKKELSRIIVEKGLPQTDSMNYRLHSVNIQTNTSNPLPHKVGSTVADSIYKRISNTTKLP